MGTEQKVAVITGASQGFGAGLVKAYRDRNYRVIANSRSIKPSKDSDVLTIAGDVADPKTADRPCPIRQHVVPFARIGMAIGRQLPFPKSEQWVAVQHIKRPIVIRQTVHI